MEPREALALIIARCPGLAHQAAGALRAHQTNSPVARERILAVVADAMREDGDLFEGDERAALVALAREQATEAGEGNRTLDLRVRVNAGEKARVQALAEGDGLTVSDYIRRRIGLGG